MTSYILFFFSFFSTAYGNMETVSKRVKIKLNNDIGMGKIGCYGCGGATGG